MVQRLQKGQLSTQGGVCPALAGLWECTPVTHNPICTFPHLHHFHIYIFTQLHISSFTHLHHSHTYTTDIFTHLHILHIYNISTFTYLHIYIIYTISTFPLFPPFPHLHHLYISTFTPFPHFHISTTPPALSSGSVTLLALLKTPSDVSLPSQSGRLSRANERIPLNGRSCTNISDLSTETQDLPAQKLQSQHCKYLLLSNPSTQNREIKHSAQHTALQQNSLLSCKYLST